MRFFSICLILVIHEVLASREGLVLPQEIEFYNSKSPIGTPSVSGHIPSSLPPLNLSPTELKLFAGHSLQLIRSKCPAVPQDTLVQLNKYISKLISKTNPVPNKSEQFIDLVTSITTCGKKEKSVKDKEATTTPVETPAIPSFLEEIIMALQSIFGSTDQVDNVEIEVELADDNTSNRPMTLLSFDEDRDYIVRPSLESDQATTDEPRTDEQTTKSGADAPTKEDSVADDDADNETPSTETTSFENSKTPITTEPTPTFIFETYIPMGMAGSFSPLSWFGSMFDMMRNFFANIFGDRDDGDDLGTSSPALNRAKRAVLGQLETIKETDMTVESTGDDKPGESEEAPENTFFVVRLDDSRVRAPNSDAVAPPAPVKVTGKDAFASLIDNLCRIYCHECSDRTQIFNFKSAAKELLEFISKDSTGIELAAKHYLHPDFMNSLNEC